MIDKIRCPVCGYDVEPYDICENCEWQNSNGTDTDLVRGPNKMTLSEAREAYKRGEQVF